MAVVLPELYTVSFLKTIERRRFREVFFFFHRYLRVSTKENLLD